MFEDIDIKAIKKELRNFSKNYIENFNKIEKFVKSEVDEILTLKKKNKSIIPEISFNQIDQEKIQEISNIKKRGCVIIRDVFDDKMIHNLNEKLEKDNCKSTKSSFSDKENVRCKRWDRILRKFRERAATSTALRIPGQTGL